MADIFDYIPIISIILFAGGIVGAILYERARTGPTDDERPPPKQRGTASYKEDAASGAKRT